MKRPNPYLAHKYPTCYVLHHHDITDEAQRRAVWMWTGIIADDLWGRVSAADRNFQLRGRVVIGLVVEAFGEIPEQIRHDLVFAIGSAVNYCRNTTL